MNFRRFKTGRRVLLRAASPFGKQCAITLAWYVLAVWMPLAFGAQTGSAPMTHDQDAVVRTVEGALNSAEADDLAGFKSHLTSGFYIYDYGLRYDAAGVIARLKQIHGSCTQMEWHVADPDVHIEGRTAWIAYVNDGSVTTAGIKLTRKWLESAVLVKVSGTWKLAFLHSTPVKEPTSAG